MPEDQSPEFIIDVHTHVFDFSFIPLTNIALRYFFNIPELFARWLGNVIRGRPTERGDALWDTFQDDDYETQKSTLIEELVDAYAAERQLDPEADAVVEQIKNEVKTSDPASIEGMPSITTAGEMDDADRRGIFRDLLKKWGPLDFVLLMMTNEERIYNYLKDEVFVDLDLYVHHMLDVNPHFYGTAEHTFPDVQVERITKLVGESDGKLLAFIPFSPWRDDSLENVVKPGINNGFVGVKFYPPSGYRPIYNLDAPGVRLPDGSYHTEQGLSGNEIDARCLELFRYCVDNDIPVLTHCTPVGFEADMGYGLNSDPYYWHCLLEEHGELSGLRLLLAHSGGSEAWFSEKIPDEEFLAPQWVRREPYGGKAFNLCVNYENIYCDASYLDTILDPESQDPFERRLIRLFEAGTPYPFADKFVYGSDFHVLMLNDKYRNFLRRYIETFNTAGLKPYREKFFWENAVRFLKLEW